MSLSIFFAYFSMQYIKMRLTEADFLFFLFFLLFFLRFLFSRTFWIQNHSVIELQTHNCTAQFMMNGNHCHSNRFLCILRVLGCCYFCRRSCCFIQSFWLCWSSKYVQGKYALSVAWFHLAVDLSFVRSVSISIKLTKWHLWSMHHTFGRMFVYSTHCKSAPSLCMIDWVNFFLVNTVCCFIRRE